MATLRGKYYTEMFKTLTDYNNHNNTPSYNASIRKEIRKVIEDESILDANNVTADTFSHTFNTKGDNANTIFTSEKLDKSGELVDAVKNLTFNDAKYYESNKANTSDSQVYLTRNTETVAHTINGNETVTLTSNGNFEQKILSNRTIPVVIPTMNLRIYQRIVPI